MRLSSAESAVIPSRACPFGSALAGSAINSGDLPFRTSLVWQPAAGFSRLSLSASVRGAPKSTPMKLLSHALFGPYPRPPNFPSLAILPFQEQGEHSHLNVIKFKVERGAIAP